MSIINDPEYRSKHHWAVGDAVHVYDGSWHANELAKGRIVAVRPSNKYGVLITVGEWTDIRVPASPTAFGYAHHFTKTRNFRGQAYMSDGGGYAKDTRNPSWTLHLDWAHLKDEVAS